LPAAIDGLRTGSDTAMYEGIMEATKALEGISGRKAILVLSDGLDNQSVATEESIVSNVGPSGLTVSAIGFGDPSGTGQAGIDEAGLQSLTSRTGGQYAYVTDAATLTALYQQTGKAYQSEYAVTFVSPFTLRDGVNLGVVDRRSRPCGGNLQPRWRVAGSYCQFIAPVPLHSGGSAGLAIPTRIDRRHLEPGRWKEARLRVRAWQTTSQTCKRTNQTQVMLQKTTGMKASRFL
jgi:hypothetical protein